MTSPLRAVAAALCAGALAGLLHGADLASALVIVAAGAVATIALRSRVRHAWTAAACVLAGLVGLTRGDLAAHGPAPVIPQELASVEGVVTRAADFDDTPPGADDETEREAVFEIATDARDDRLEIRVAFREGDDVPALLPGDRVRLVGSAAPVSRPTNPGEPDRREELRRAGICGQLHVTAAGAVTDLGTPPMGLVTRVRRAGEIVRRALLERLRAACGGPGPTPALLGCLLLGDRSGLEPSTTDAFRDSGTAHLLSVSGLHVVLLAEAARLLVRRLIPRRARRRLALPSLVALLFVYCALCRFATPVVRAAVFLAVAQTARSFGRRPSPLDTLAVAATLVVAVDAAQILDPSFVLSFAAVAGLAIFTRGFRTALFPSLALYRKFPGAISKRRMWVFERFAAAWSTSLAASAATAPVVAQVFGRLQPSAPVSNLLAVPLAAFLVPFAAVLAFAGGCAPWLTAPLAHAAVAPLRVTASLAARLPGATFEIGVPPPMLVAASVALLVVAASSVGARPRAALRLTWASWLVLAATPFARPSADGPEIVALDVGHGLCVLARSGTGGGVLFDAGGHAPRIGRRLIVPALRAMGVRRLAAVFVSHQDADHCCAVADILTALPVDEVLVSGGFGSDPLPAALVAKCRDAGVPVTVVSRGDSWIRRGLLVRILSPPRDVTPLSDNEASIVAHVSLDDGRVTALIPGDIDGAPLAALARDPTAPSAKVLLLPHHGRGDPGVQLTLARRLGADVLIASTSASAPLAVTDALVTGIDGAVRVRPGEPPATFPWPGR